jgi:hypothetical protein
VKTPDEREAVFSAVWLERDLISSIVEAIVVDIAASSFD